MKKVMAIFGAILFASTILTSCGGSDNPAEKNGGYFSVEFNESKQFYFKGGPTSGTVDTWKNENVGKSCLTTGSWEMDGDVIIITGLNNPNCTEGTMSIPDISKRNGKYKINGEYLVEL